MKASARQLAVLVLTGVVVAAFIVVAANRLRADDHALAWLAIGIATLFTMVFARTLNQVFLQQTGSAYAVEPGDLVSVLVEDHEHAVMKVLASDETGVHARLYAQRFAERPKHVDPATLYVAPLDADAARVLSIGHMPLSWAAFAAWKPEIIESGLDVAEEELEGFRLWQEAGGGYF